MIELPEAATLARQIAAELRGRRVVAADRGNSPHKWVWYKPSPEEVAERLVGATIAGARAAGRDVQISLASGEALHVGDFGGRILLHRPAAKLPAKRHLRIELDDAAQVTVAIQGWGFIGLLSASDAAALPHGISPSDEALTDALLAELLSSYEPKARDSLKAFFTNGRSLAGIGNGCLQDILFRAGIDPRRKVADVSSGEVPRLHRAVVTTMAEAAALDGRSCERDLYGRPGRYQPLMDQHAKGQPCPVCGTAVEKISYLGGSCYLCPACQR